MAKIKAKARPRTKDDQIVLRVPASLKANLKQSANEDGRPLADYVRRLLVAAEAPQFVRREQPTAGA